MSRFASFVRLRAWPASPFTFLIVILQAYQASFRINAANSSVSNTVYAFGQSERTTKALRICGIAFDAFVEDVKELVTEGVRADIRQTLNSATSHSKRNAAAARGASRESNLKSWLKEEFPLRYGKGAGNETYTYLLRAVTPDRTAQGLPNWQNNSTSPSMLADTLFKMSRAKKPTQTTAPVLEKGSFLPVLKVAHSEILGLVKGDADKSTSQKEDFVKDVLAAGFKEFNIHFFPFSRTRVGSSGAPYRKPVFDSWGYLGMRDSPSRISSGVPFSSTSLAAVSPETVAYNNAIAADCNADWTASNLTIVTLKGYLKKTRLPLDFGPVSKSDAPYVNDTFKWVRDNYDGTNHIHHLALLVSIIVATSFLPNLFMPDNVKHLFKYANTEAEVHEVYNSIKWTSKSKGGMKDKTIFIAMFTTLIISLYEKDSPLRRHMALNTNAGLGIGWTKKHSAFLVSLLLFLPVHPTLVLIFIFSTQRHHLQQPHPSQHALR